MNKSNYYEILNLNKNASQDEIKKAYRKMSLMYHPDKNNDSEESKKKMQEIAEAYEILGNPETRHQYDNGTYGLINNFNDMPFDVNDIFANLFGQSFPHHQSGSTKFNVFFGGSPFNASNFQHIIRIQPIMKTIVIPFEKVFMDLKIPVEIKRVIKNENQNTEEIETIYVDILKGIDDGEIITIKEKGNCIDGVKGDVKLIIKIDNKTEFKRDGLDLIYTKTITLKEALCGFSFELKYLNGKVYTITNSSTIGHVIHQNYNKTIPNMGLIRENYVGNLVIIFNIKFPEILETEIVEELKKINF